jgi:hypothetical protein
VECEVDHTTSPRPLHPGKLDRRVSCNSAGSGWAHLLAARPRRGTAPLKRRTKGSLLDADLGSRSDAD